eukprot:6563293-Pyramimonas_sp.AAC.1
MEVLGFMYHRYQPEWYAFELVVILRKALVVTTTVMVSDVDYHSAKNQAIIAMSFLLIALLIQ